MTVATFSDAPAATRQRPVAPLAAAMLLPIAIVNAIGFLAPVANLFRMSFNEATGGGGLREAVTFANYLAFVMDPFYLELVTRSIGMSLAITLLTLVASYPIALFIHRAPAQWKSLLTIVTVSPLLVSAVVRTYGWMLILGDRGLVNGLLTSAGVIHEPLRLVNNTTGVVIGLVEILMPYMVLSLMAGFGRLDRTYEEAAQSLGAMPWTAFRRVVVPLTLPGIALGCLLCFVLAVSSFITPKLLGGGRVFLLATEIYDQAIVILNWPLAATMSIVILAIFGLALVAYTRVVRLLD
ncbi:ABC transporter permease [Chelatococcus sp. SYSU_G07232]|uniref:ABC transporter permease n=1 Tax=Chelatococcus albus TaxID=3047466 RepID=A0ABT7AG57_9HYPH|nr:ABC transporter permease [Chelatococcus sp. SYSU_G07232]MDJ1157631.1 ABC transporter permease [Chelatococcus sp. SYSU_G07232]